MTQEILRASFTICEAALRAIEELRAEAFEEGREPSVAMIGWGRFVPYSGSPSEGAVVGFYPQEQRASIAHGIQTVSGLDLVFFVTDETALHFAGRILDHAAQRGFFLRG